MWSISVRVPRALERPHAALSGAASHKHPYVVLFGSASQISSVLADFRIVPSVMEMRPLEALDVFMRHVS